jgi:hypothetical protein
MTFYSGVDAQILFDWWCTNEILGYLASLFVLFCIGFLNQFIYSLIRIKPKKEIDGIDVYIQFDG